MYVLYMTEIQEKDVWMNLLKVACSRIINLNLFITCNT